MLANRKKKTKKAKQREKEIQQSVSYKDKKIMKELLEAQQPRSPHEAQENEKYGNQSYEKTETEKIVMDKAMDNKTVLQILRAKLFVKETMMLMLKKMGKSVWIEKSFK